MKRQKQEIFKEIGKGCIVIVKSSDPKTKIDIMKFKEKRQKSTHNKNPWFNM